MAAILPVRVGATRHVRRPYGNADLIERVLEGGTA
jgi:hypothetical protein